MPEYTIKVPASVAISTSLANLPDPVKDLLKQGFAVLPSVSASTLDKLVEAIRELISAMPGEFPEGLSRSLGLDDEAASTAIVAAGSILAGFLTVEDANITEVIDTLFKANLIEEGARSRVLELANKLVGHRDYLKAEARRRNLQGATLPNLHRFEASVDVRVAFDAEKISLVVPVLVGHLETDEAHVEVWFQMTLAQVEKMIKDLQKLRDNMKEAQRLFGGLPKQ